MSNLTLFSSRIAVNVLLLWAATLQAQNTGVVFEKRDTVKVIPVVGLPNTLSGRVYDMLTMEPLAGAAVIVDSLIYAGTSTDRNGYFEFPRVSVGRHVLHISFLGYTPANVSIMVSSAQKATADVALLVSPLYLAEVSVYSDNMLPPIGGSEINTDDLNKHAGNRGEAIRKVAVLPGIQNADDSRNDIIVRRNSPQAVLWRMEGINIPNPNHFAIPGTSGGPVTVINDRLLGASSFYAGAFPAQFGNTISGIFDLSLRNGDTSRHTFVGQVGLLGAEVGSEGPLSSRHSASYLVSFRHSTLDFVPFLLQSLGTEAKPRYTDLGFKLHFPVRHKASISVFGLGGLSAIDILISKQRDPSKNFYGEKDRNQNFKSNMGIAGITYHRQFAAQGFVKATVAFSGQWIDSRHELAKPDSIRLGINEKLGVADDFLPPIQRYNFQDRRISVSVLYTRKQRNHLYFQAGLNSDLFFYRFYDSLRNLSLADNPDFGTWRVRWHAKASAVLVQPFVQWKYTGNRVDVNAGVHQQYFSLTNSVSWVEPRVAINYHVSKTLRLHAAAGMHSQIQQPYLYFYGSENDNNGMPIRLNDDMDFSRSVHTVAGAEKWIESNGSFYRLKADLFYQYLYRIPIDRLKATSYSLLNAGANFVREFPDELANNGEGYNYGVELTFEKSFSKRFLFLFNSSLFDSRYRGSDGIWRDTDFNSNYVVNALFTYEWTTRKQNVLTVGTKVATTGGRRYGPVDEQASIEQQHVVYVDAFRNTKQFKPYFRCDLRVGYTMNYKAFTQEVAVDIINLFNIQNELRLTYVPDEKTGGRVEPEHQLGFLPFFYYRILFNRGEGKGL